LMFCIELCNGGIFLVQVARVSDSPSSFVKPGYPHMVAVPNVERSCPLV
jgi:hypothetical protein